MEFRQFDFLSEQVTGILGSGHIYIYMAVSYLFYCNKHREVALLHFLHFKSYLPARDRFWRATKKSATDS